LNDTQTAKGDDMPFQRNWHGFKDRRASGLLRITDGFSRPSQPTQDNLFINVIQVGVVEAVLRTAPSKRTLRT
jgi:hypothetical protein